ncbi:MAG: DEAD/DEAH box helicase [Chloroflexota bacterium]|nr:MAG: DEAD/DEAH box helicase [Chloroflexota bacterium]
MAAPSAPTDPLERFSPAVRAWFRSTFEAPTPAQIGGWAAIASGDHTLIHAPTGSGKTLAAFLFCLDRLLTAEPAADGPRPGGEPAGPGPAGPPSGSRRRRAGRGIASGVRVLYVSPLKALAYDIERNLRAPLVGIARAAERLGTPVREVRVAVRTGDTPADHRRRMATDPPDILVTTPESLYLLLTSAAREALRSVEVVIVDEVHALAGTKRGAHLALSLERLEALRPPGAARFQRIGLSATQRPLETIARFLGGVGPDRGVTIVDAGAPPNLDLSVVVPVDDMARLGEPLSLDERPGGPAVLASTEGRRSIWPAVYPALLAEIRAHRSTLVFVNSRRLAERLAGRLNELAGVPIARAHHGSVAPEERRAIEDELKAGRLPALVATSSLELGIDMGAVDSVVCVESPPSVASGLQRVGRAGHRVGLASRGRIVPKFRGDLLEAAVVAERMRRGEIESTAIPRNPLDVLAQQIVAMAVMDRWSVEELWRVVTRAAPYETLSRSAFEGVLAMLAGAYADEAFAELRPRIVWDRVAGTIEGRRDARTVAVTSGGTIPDRGLYGVFMIGEAGRPGRRVGELDEEMVYESRVGEVITLGASAWRIEDITPDRVLVSPAPGEPGKLPFWKGDGLGRPVELGRAIGAFVRELEGAFVGGSAARAAARERLLTELGLDERAADNLLAYLEEERAICGALPTDRRIVVERFRDELGDWRLVVLSPFGGRVHAAWTLALQRRLGERLGGEVAAIWSDDGIALRLPEGDAGEAEALLFPDPDEIETLVVEGLETSPLFAARFRENAARALLLPRRRPGSRTPLWQQRQRAADLLAVARRHPSFPILVETYRECLADVFDLGALRQILAAVARREIAVHRVETARPSPFASSLLFDYVALYMYEGDAPLAERRAGALSLDRDLLRELLGADEFRELLDPDAVAELELELQALAPERRARSADDLADLLRRLGDLRSDELAARAVAEPATVAGWLAELEAQRRVVRLRIAGEERFVALDDVARYRDALGVAPPPGTPEPTVGPAPDESPLESLLVRWARTHGPFLARDPALRWALAEGTVTAALERLAARGAVVRGAFRPGGAAIEWCDPGVLRTLRRRSVARLRREVEPVDAATYARFLLAWQGVGAVGQLDEGPTRSVPAGEPPGNRPAVGGSSPTAALDRLVAVLDQLAGIPIPASVLERDVLPARVPGYAPRLLDELGTLGEVGWVGAGSLGGRDDGRIVLLRPGREALAPPPLPPDERPSGPLHDAVREYLARHGASFFRVLAGALVGVGGRSSGRSERELLDALWDLVWAGEVTNDTFAPLRALRWKRPSPRRPPAAGRLARLGPPEAAGRWSLATVATGGGADERPARPPAATLPAPSSRRATTVAHAWSVQLLDRYGVVGRASLVGDGPVGGFGAVYGVLRAMEEAGQVQRGYFVEGLGGAQFAPRTVVDRLRSLRSTAADRAVHLIAATDPANPYGSLLPWPRREAEPTGRGPARVAGAYVVLVDGEPVLYLERGGASLFTLPAADEPPVAALALEALGVLVEDGRYRELVVERVDGEPVAASPWRDRLLAAGFVRGYRGLVRREARARTA